MNRYLVIVSLMALSACTTKSSGQFPYSLKTLEGKETSIKIKKDTRGIVFIFLVPDCPFSQMYTVAVNQVYSSYFFRGFQFYGVVPGELYSLKEINSFKKNYNFFPEILLDEKYKLTKKYNVRVVPQVLVTGIDGEVLYSGKIDDQAVSPGQKKYQPTRFYLLNALKNISEGKPVAIKTTKPVGCFIE